MSANVTYALVNNNHDLLEILKDKDHVIALFYASWCPFCVRFLPIFKKHAEGKGQNFIIVQDDEEKIADQYSVKVYPTVLFFERGAISKRLDGLLGVGLDEKQLVEFVSMCPLS
ncbi:MAG: protein disulfide isomerase family protein [Syntrophales bacterium]|jgi:thioredoxin 1|nr:protein disulfide isomerase family protein [Syntrophales bacterium]